MGQTDIKCAKCDYDFPLAQEDVAAPDESHRMPAWARRSLRLVRLGMETLILSMWAFCWALGTRWIDTTGTLLLVNGLLLVHAGTVGILSIAGLVGLFVDWRTGLRCFSFAVLGGLNWSVMISEFLK